MPGNQMAENLCCTCTVQGMYNSMSVWRKNVDFFHERKKCEMNNLKNLFLYAIIKTVFFFSLEYEN